MPLGAPVACPTRIKRPPAPILSLRILTPPTRQFGLGTCLNYNHIDICNSWRQSGSRIFSSGSRPPEVQRPAGLVASSGLAHVFCEHLFCIFTFLEAILHEFVEAGAGLPGFLFCIFRIQMAILCGLTWTRVPDLRGRPGGRGLIRTIVLLFYHCRSGPA